MTNVWKEPEGFKTIADCRAEIVSALERGGTDPGHVDALISAVLRDAVARLVSAKEIGRALYMRRVGTVADLGVGFDTGFAIMLMDRLTTDDLEIVYAALDPKHAEQLARAMMPL